MKEIPLTFGKVALVDDSDFDYLNQFKWHAAKRKCGIWYAERSLKINGKRTVLPMHRDIIQTAKGMDTDHRDGNGLNNQRFNLRECTHTDNIHNQKRQESNNKSSVFKGVSWCSQQNKWRAHIKLHRKTIFIGRFISEIQAALAYDAAAKKYHGEFARLNFIEV